MNTSAIEHSLLTLYPFSPQQIEQFINKLKYRSLRKKELLLQKGEVSSNLFFIINGAIRFYTRSGEIELTQNFYTENLWVTDLESFASQQPSANFIEALEETTVASVSLQDIHSLMDLHADFRMLNALTANLSVATAQLTSLKTFNPDDRYKELLLKNPDWINRFPQHQIASYLGMTPETLSRVRSRMN